MTEERLAKILRENGCIPYEHLMKAMKQAVNEAVQECMDIAYENVVDIPPIINEMRNLKVK